MTVGMDFVSDRWHRRYLGVAKVVSHWSKDPSTQVGAVAVGSKGQLLSQGYNGFPRGIEDDVNRLNDRETKYQYIVHAEMNCIYNATYNGVSLDGSTMYIYGLPICSECAKGIIQVGVKKVVMPNRLVPEKWRQSFELTKSMFAEAGVEWKMIDYESIDNWVEPFQQN